MNDDDLFKLLVQLKMRVDDKEREKKAMNMANDVYVTYRRLKVNIDDDFINEYDGVFVSERDATLHLEETYGKDWYGQGYRKLKQYIAKY